VPFVIKMLIKIYFVIVEFELELIISFEFGFDWLKVQMNFEFVVFTKLKWFRYFVLKDLTPF
jgi:hypothetical protein